MKIVNTIDGQTLIDITMQELGNVERVYELCLLNDLSLTDELETGTTLLVPDFESDKRRIVALFSDRSLAPASIDDLDLIPGLPPGGIGFMQIENNFIIS